MRKVSDKQWIESIVESCSFLTEEWERELMTSALWEAVKWGRKHPTTVTEDEQYAIPESVLSDGGEKENPQEDTPIQE